MMYAAVLWLGAGLSLDVAKYTTDDLKQESLVLYRCDSVTEPAWLGDSDVADATVITEILWRFVVYSPAMHESERVLVGKILQATREVFDDRGERRLEQDDLEESAEPGGATAAVRVDSRGRFLPMRVGGRAQLLRNDYLAAASFMLVPPLPEPGEAFAAGRQWSVSRDLNSDWIVDPSTVTCDHVLVWPSGCLEVLLTSEYDLSATGRRAGRVNTWYRLEGSPPFVMEATSTEIVKYLDPPYHPARTLTIRRHIQTLSGGIPVAPAAQPGDHTP